MRNKIIAYDLGTGGIKASLYNADGNALASVFEAYETFYDGVIHEQKPNDWWMAIIRTTQLLIEQSDTKVNTVAALSISGHSLGAVPLDKDGNLIRTATPIWSDKRAAQQCSEFFEKVDYQQWYETTGNGFPPECYTLFKVMWYRANETELFNKTHKIVGTKDYCNFMLTGRIVTDHSYASGSGAYNLIERGYENHYLDAAGISRYLLPEIIESDEIIGNLTPQAAQLLGLDTEVKVVCGGVDNSCMALGAKGIKPERIYTSLGSSAWIALIAEKPVIDFKYKPYVFAHVVKGLYTSATCIFSAGTSFKWVRDLCCQDLLTAEQQSGVSAWNKINEMIDSSPAGANGVVFNPSLAGGSMLEPSPIMTGAFMGLKISNTRADILRATQEGIALNLRIALDVLLKERHNVHQMLIVGGGAKSNVWMQIFADIYQLNIEKTSIDQEAASLGAAALALKGIGLWKDFSPIDLLHKSVNTFTPNHKTQQLYDQLLQQFKSLAHYIAKPL